MLQKFVLILNTKKKKIRELKKQIIDMSSSAKALEIN